VYLSTDRAGHGAVYVALSQDLKSADPVFYLILRRLGGVWGAKLAASKRE
jgi:hypothetical protein